MAGYKESEEARAAAIALRLAPAGAIPNSRLPLLHYEGVLPPELRAAGACQALFRRNGWGGAWVNGIYDYWHFHSRGHEVLGCIAGEARIGFGGEGGATVTLRAGDVVVIPAGIGHRRLAASADFLVVGAYPPGQEGDIVRPGDLTVEAAAEALAALPLPLGDPVSGFEGPLLPAWRDAG